MPGSRTKPVVLAQLMRTLEELDAGLFDVPRQSKVSKTQIRRTLRRRIGELKAQGVEPSTAVSVAGHWKLSDREQAT